MVLLKLSLCLALLLPPVSAGAATYWHFTLTISDASNQEEREWAWITMKEIPRARAYPEEAAVIRRAGGRLQGTVFGLVRGAAWRAAHAETETLDCGNLFGRRGSREMFWHESESESLFAHGGIPADGNDFSLQINARRVLRENGTWFDPQSQPTAFAGPIREAGDPEIRIKGSYSVRGINYQDPNVYYRQECPGESQRMWAKQFRSKLIQFSKGAPLRGILAGNSAFGQDFVTARGKRFQLVYEAIRSNSRAHPNWKRRSM
ncbi:MAG: hypothetical protein WBM40_16490 [Thiohalocapsa sp.]